MNDGPAPRWSCCSGWCAAFGSRPGTSNDLNADRVFADCATWRRSARPRWSAWHKPTSAICEASSSAARMPSVAPTTSFDACLYGFVDFAVRDHLRNRFGRAPTPPSDRAEQRSNRSRASETSRHTPADSTTSERVFLSVGSVTAQLTIGEIRHRPDRRARGGTFCAGYPLIRSASYPRCSSLGFESEHWVEAISIWFAPSLLLILIFKTHGER
jgi:hypothetical protein